MAIGSCIMPGAFLTEGATVTLRCEGVDVVQQTIAAPWPSQSRSAATTPEPGAPYSMVTMSVNGEQPALLQALTFQLVSS